MNPSLPEIAEALTAAGFDTEVREPTEKFPERLNVSRGSGRDRAEITNWYWGGEDFRLEVAARSAVLNVAPGSYARPALESENEGKVLIVFWDENHRPIERPKPVYYTRADTYTSAWLYALVDLHKSGMLP